jgi:hypothetical protein
VIFREAARAVGVVALAGVAVTACSSDKTAHRRDATTRPLSTSAPARPQHLVIKTRFVDFDGEVLAGSVIAESPFCPGGKLHHEHGSPDIGFPAVNVFTCGGSELRIGFGPGPEQMNNRIQTSEWRVVGGTGDFAGMTGSGHMQVVFPRVGASSGRETFTGTVVVH